ncbi:MAG: hypothetical protein RBR16_05680 [Syntrophus sp. (in: bacteria)]|nr:hypothetical protein [Syntrophus sp. (in: bacteria)]
MADIKSTLDLIMERTKGLTMTEKEKRALHSRELGGKVKGRVQKCIDGTLNLARLKEEIKQEKAKEPELLPVLMKELLDRVDPDGNSELVFQMMESILHRDVAPLRELVDGYRTELSKKERELAARATSDLTLQGISGSAVVPNLDRDPRWIKDREQLKNRYIQKIRSAVAR